MAAMFFSRIVKENMLDGRPLRTLYWRPISFVASFLLDMVIFLKAGAVIGTVDVSCS